MQAPRVLHTPTKQHRIGRAPRPISARSANFACRAMASTADVVVVTIPACPYCRKAKAALTEASIPFSELDASRDQSLRATVRQLSGSATVPQVFVGGVSLGGSDDLAVKLADGSFQAALKSAQDAGRPALPPELLQVSLQALERQAAAVAAQEQGIPLVTDQVVGSGGDSGLLSPDQEALVVAMKLQGVIELLEDPASGVPREMRTIMGRAQQVFSGESLLVWLAQAGLPTWTPSATATRNTSVARQWLAMTCMGRQGAEEAASKLLAANLIALATESLPQENRTLRVDPGNFYLVASTAAPPVRGQPLNTVTWWNGPARPADQVAGDLRDLILQLYDRHLSADGRAVNYEGMKQDKLFSKYVAATTELQRVNLGPLSREQLCALFINLYNALIVHAVVVLGQPQNAAQRSAFFSRDAAYCIAGYTYTADDMEHGVLRGNRPPASNLFALVGLHRFASKQFKDGDPRASKVVTPMDPRIHFALVCGAKSCPPIGVYSEENLNEGLEAAAEAFCAGEVEVDISKRLVKLSKILQWYSIDFGSNDREKLQYVSQFLKGSARADLESLLSSNERVRIEYKPYDWGLNT